MSRAGTLIAALVLSGAVVCAPRAHAQAPAPYPPDPGQTTTGTVTSNGSIYPYILYTPTTYRPGHALPLVVMVHGCQTTADTELHVTLFNKLAEREGFAVLYPEVDDLGRNQPGPASQCWKFTDPASYFRGSGDDAAIADMTRVAMGKLTIDPDRVYLVGVSAGGLMASVDAATYPDIFAAVGIVESAGYADAPCFATGVGIPVQASAQLAFAQMGPRARVVPIFAIGSTGDLAFPKNCADKGLEQGLRTDNLVISGAQGGPIALTPASTHVAQRPGGRTYKVFTYRDPDGCLIGSKTIIDGMPHAWPGGTTDPKYKGYGDPSAPEGAEIAWAFFQHFTKSQTSMPCAETPVAAPAAASSAPTARRCPTRWLRVRVPRGLRAIRAKVNGRRAKIRRVRGGVLVRAPAGARARTTVVVRAHTRDGRAVSRRRSFAGCGH
jgi:poly(hydroxyalkanoate) depolymerase family esterase